MDSPYGWCGYPVDSTDPKMLDWDWRELPKIGVEALLKRFDDARYALRICGAGIRRDCFARRTASSYGLSERPNAHRHRSVGKNHHIM